MPMKSNDLVATQKDIARAVGVHPSLVSMALRGHPHVAPGTREEILRIAEGMGYRANAALSAAAGSRWKQQGGPRREIVAFIQTLREAGAGSDQIEVAARERLDQLGYGMQVIAAQSYPSEAALNRVLIERGIRGILLEQNSAEDRLRHLDWDRFCVVQCGLLQDVGPLHQVCLDFQAVVNGAVSRLDKAGYRRIGCLLPRSDYLSNRLLRQAIHGANEIFSSVKIAVLPNLAAAGPFRPEVLLVIKPVAYAVPQVALIGDHAGAGLPGYEPQMPSLGRLGAELLDQRLRSHDYGRPRIPQRLVFVPPWRDAPAVPTKSAVR